MTGYLVPEVWCDFCTIRILDSGDGTVTDLRSTLKAKGWRQVCRNGALLDRCPGCADTVDVEWRDVPGYPGYSVSSLGAIRGPRRLLRPMENSDGYLYIFASRPGVPRKLFVHRAVLLAFVGKPEPGQETRHLDRDPSNNSLRNLAWGTRFENSADRQRHGTQSRGERAGTAKLSDAAVREIRRLYGKQSLRQLALLFGVSHTAIRQAALGLKWGHVE